MGRALVEVDLHLDAESRLPHLLEQLRIGAGGGAGAAIGQGHRKGGGIGAKPGFLHALDEQRLRVGIGFGQSQQGLRRDLTEIHVPHIAHRGHQTEGRLPQATGHDLRQKLPVQRQRKRLADLHVGEYLVFAVEHQHGGAVRGDVQLVHILPGGELIGILLGADGGVVEGAVFERSHLGALVGDNVIGKAVQSHVRRVPVELIPGKLQNAAVDPGVQHEGAAAEDGLCLCAVGIAVLIHAVLPAGENVHRGEKCWVWGVQGDDQGVVVHCGDADGTVLAVIALLKALDAEKVAGKAPGIGGISLAQQRRAIVVCRDPLSVAPIVLLKVEGVYKAVFGDLKALRPGLRDDAVFDAGQGLRDAVEDIPVHDAQEPGAVETGRLADDQGVQMVIAASRGCLHGGDGLLVDADAVAAALRRGRRLCFSAGGQKRQRQNQKDG